MGIVGDTQMQRLSLMYQEKEGCEARDAIYQNI